VVAPVGPSQAGVLAPPALEIPAQARARLPKTATSMPLIGLAGLALLLSAAFIAGAGMVRRGHK
jgi:LPXTG-motif cell wall-anchored protein